MPEILNVKGLSKRFKSGGNDLTVLEEINFKVTKGERLAIVGPSGSGKTTLLGLCAGLDQPSRGQIWLNEIALHELNEDERARVRNEHVGFVFQNFQLIPSLTALENVMVPLELHYNRKAEARAKELLGQVGLADRATHYPVQLSGGEQQRVAMARAFANDPSILFADEPTGNLDEETSDMVEKLFFNLNSATRTTLVLVTHNLDLAHQTDRILRLKGGRIVADEKLAKV